MAVDDRLGQAGRPRREQHVQRVVERDGVEGERRGLGEQRPTRRPRPGRPRRRRPRSGGRARRRSPGGWAGRRGSRRSAPTGRSPCRRTGSRRPRAAPWARSGRTGRRRPGSRTRARRTTRWRPSDAVARRPITASGMFGRNAATRSPRPTPWRARPARQRATASRSSAAVSSTGSRVCDRATITTSSGGSAGHRQGVLGVVDQGVREPAGAGHACDRRGRGRAAARERTPKWSQTDCQNAPGSSTDQRQASS